MTLVTGSGSPVTVVAHGLGATIGETRPLLSGVPGTKAYLEAAGHGRPFTGEAGYQPLAAELLALADEHRATQALGVSLGAGAVLRVLSQDPDRFARVVLYLPPALDQVNPASVRRGETLHEALAAADPEVLAAVVRAELPAVPAVERYAAARTDFLLRSDLAPWLEALRHDVPVPDRALLRSVTADVLLVAERDDPVHPQAVAEDLATVLPQARLEVFEHGALFAERARLRAVISGFLAGPSGPTGSDRPDDA